MPNSVDWVTATTPGWDRWFAKENANESTAYYDYDVVDQAVVRHYGAVPATYATDVLGEQAVSFVRDAPAGRPWFLYFSPNAPHEPWVPAPRYARQDVELSGVAIPRGGELMVALASANRDERQFADPDALDITREPNRHLAFGLGAHFCLGAPLARLEAAIALTAFARRVTDPELADGGLSYKPNFNLRGPDRLLIDTRGTKPAAWRGQPV